MSSIIWFLILMALAAAMAVVVVLCLAPRMSILDAMRRLSPAYPRTAAVARWFLRHGESGLARVQRRIFAEVITVLPRSRAGVVVVPARITVDLGATFAAAVAGFERIVIDELVAELTAHARQFKMATPARLVVTLVPRPALEPEGIVVHLGELTVMEGVQTQVMPVPGAVAGLKLTSESGLVGVVGSRPVVAGRSPANDLVVADPKVSARHCRFERTGDDVIVVDLGSSNGTRVNGAVVTKSSIRLGDRVSIGATTFEVSAA